MALQILLFIVELCIVTPPISLFFFSPRSSRFCDEPLLNITVAGIVFTFAMIGEHLQYHSGPYQFFQAVLL